MATALAQRSVQLASAHEYEIPIPTDVISKRIDKTRYYAFSKRTVTQKTPARAHRAQEAQTKC